jgi:hypothetical protein
VRKKPAKLVLVAAVAALFGLAGAASRTCSIERSRAVQHAITHASAGAAPLATSL